MRLDGSHLIRDQFCRHHGEWDLALAPSKLPYVTLIPSQGPDELCRPFQCWEAMAFEVGERRRHCDNTPGLDVKVRE